MESHVPLGRSLIERRRGRHPQTVIWAHERYVRVVHSPIPPGPGVTDYGAGHVEAGH